MLQPANASAARKFPRGLFARPGCRGPSRKAAGTLDRVSRVAALAGVGALCLVLAGCLFSFGPRWPELERADQRAKRFEPREGLSLLYVFRDTSVAPTHRLGLYLDDTLLGSLSTKTYFVCEVPPGGHRLTVRAPAGQETPTLQLQMEPGALYFVRHTYDRVEAGAPQTTQLERVEPGIGRRAVDELDLVPSACYEDQA